MNVAKLTLSVPPVLVSKGKRIAQRQGHSLSGLISGFLENLEEPDTDSELLPEIKQMCGAYRLPNGKSEDDLKFEYLMEKHVHD
jgi:hypothetical protein